MAQKGRILFQDTEDAPTKPMKLELVKEKYQPKILFQDEEPQETTGLKGVLEDALNKSIDYIKGIPGALKELPNEVSGLAHQEPSRLARNIGTGLGEFGHSILSAPGNVRDYLVRKQLASEKSPSFRLPENILPKEYNYGEAFGLGENQPGDVLAQAIPSMLAAPGELSLLRKTPGFRPSSRHQQYLTKALEDIEGLKKEHSNYLGAGQEHGARASQQFLDFIEGKVNPQTGRTEGGLRRQVGSQYEKLAEDMANENVQIAQTPDLKSIQKSISKLGKGVAGAEKEKLLKIMAQADNKLHTVNGADALTAYRELKRQKSKSLQSAYEPGIGPKEHAEWLKKSQELGELEKKMKTMLEKQIGGKYLERLKSIDKQYATQIAPLSENTMYQEMLKHGQTSKNMMKYLNGKTAGNETLNAIAEKNPELQRVIVGQKFAEHPEKLTNNKELLNKYKQLNPQISKIMSEQEGIKHFEENILPQLKEAVKKAHEKKISRKGFRRGLATAGTGLGAAYLLGGDYKKDLPFIAALRMLLSKNK